mgnify:CR=1 FL=1
MKIYIAGKIAGDRRYRAKFREAAKAMEAVAASAWRVMTANRNVPPNAATGVILLSVQRGIQTAAGKSGRMNMEEIGLDRSGK